MKTVLIILAVAAMLILPSQTACVTPEPPGFIGLNSGNVTSSNGLTLSLTMNSTRFKPGEEISFKITEYNTLQSTNRIEVSGNWPLPGLTLGP
jgi:hypothetical protein